MSEQTIGFIGLGLIGGSIARGIKRAHPDTVIMAYMRSRARLEQAKQEGIVDIILNGADEQLRQCDMNPPLFKIRRYCNRCGKHKNQYPRRGHPASDGGLFCRRPSDGWF